MLAGGERLVEAKQSLIPLPLPPSSLAAARVHGSGKLKAPSSECTLCPAAITANLEAIHPHTGDCAWCSISLDAPAQCWSHTRTGGMKSRGILSPPCLVSRPPPMIMHVIRVR